MPDPRAILRPLDDEAASIAALTTYENPAALAAALRGAWRGVERALRHLLRADADAPDDLRLSALSTTDLPFDRLIPALSRQNLISLRLAGMAHQLEQAARRAERGDVHASDADAALSTIERLRDEVRASAGPETTATAATGHEPVADADEVVVYEGHVGRRGLVVALGLLVVAAALAVLIFRPGPDPLQEAVTAFAQDRLGIAESGFRRALERDEANVTALLYLGRIYRRQDRHREAADVLARASELAPADAAVKRELGYLFLDLNRPEPAVQQFRQAQELEPDEDRNWIGLIRALRAAGDPEAEVVLRQAPASVRAALTSGLLPPDTT